MSEIYLNYLLTSDNPSNCETQCKAPKMDTNNCPFKKKEKGNKKTYLMNKIYWTEHNNAY